MTCRHLVLILGDQLDRESAVLGGVNGQDRLLMIEARAESRRVPSHKARTTLFLSAMRHHAEWLRAQGHTVDYINIDEAESLAETLAQAIKRWQPQRVRMVEAGEFGIERDLSAVCRRLRVPLDLLPDTHFFVNREAFADWRASRKTMVMEHFYRAQRKAHGILMTDGQPTGGSWNYDAQNRKGPGRKGPGMVPQPVVFEADAITASVQEDVERLFPDNPGKHRDLRWPVTREDALKTLTDFVDHRLVDFGTLQDAMWDAEPFLYHAMLSASMNLKLLSPREVIEAVLTRFEAGDVPLNSAEGFIRQVLGWREYVRGVYWTEMPDYVDRNALDARHPLPDFYWNADTDMACLQNVIRQTLDTAYAHHIQRLMVTGLFALIYGVDPKAIHAWYLAIYADAVEWVEAPNTLGMSQYADGGVMASKPYAASGQYIHRMSNYCSGCRYDPKQKTGDKACPFTTLYWDFLIRHEDRFANHPRAAMQWRNLTRLDDLQRQQIQHAADEFRTRLG